jgi:hypothetical protein
VTLDIIQLLALVAVLTGVALTVPIGLALIIDGGLVLGAAVVAERWG